MKLYIVRHGQSVGNETGNVQGQDPSVDKGLSTMGQRQAALVGKRFGDMGLTRLYSSPLPRARETAQFISDACGLEVVELPWLVEVSYGVLEGQPQAQMHKEYPGVYDAAWRQANPVPGGEIPSDYYARARLGIAELEAEHSADDVVCCVTHGEFLSKLVDTLLGADEWGFPRYMVNNTSVSYFVRYPSSGGAVWICRYIGDTGHLQGLTSPRGQDGW